MWKSADMRHGIHLNSKVWVVLVVQVIPEDL